MSGEAAERYVSGEAALFFVGDYQGVRHIFWPLFVGPISARKAPLADWAVPGCTQTVLAHKRVDVWIICFPATVSSRRV